MLKKLSNNETRVVKMFNKNQHKLKARGWATQTELVCQDHNRGFVISLYIIFFIFSSKSVSFSSISFLVLSNLCYHTLYSDILCSVFFLSFLPEPFLYNHVSIKTKKIISCTQTKKNEKSHPKIFLQKVLATCLLIKFTSLYLKSLVKIRKGIATKSHLSNLDLITQVLDSTDIILHQFNDSIIFIIYL